MTKHANTRNKRLLILLACSLCILVLIGGYFYFRYEENLIRKDKYDDIKTIAKLKIDQITKWRKERLGDANVFYKSSFFERGVAQFLLNGHNADLKSDILAQLSITKTQYGYENIFITSPKGEVVLSVDSALKIVDSITRRFITEVTIRQKVTFTDLYYCPLHRKIHYDIIIPVINRNDISIATLVFRVDPNEFLYPLIQSWPTPSKSSEILIARKNGDSVLFLNELRFRFHTALSLQFPLTKSTLPSVRAVLGYEGIWEGKDYRGVEVLAFLCKVPGTPWFMVAKIDQSEIFSELYYRAAVIAIFTLILIILTAVSISRFYYNRQRNIYRELFLKEKVLTEIQEEYRTTLYSIGDGVITTDATGIIRHINPVAEQLTGWKESGAMGRILEEVFRIANEKTKTRVNIPVERVLKEGVIAGLADHSLLISITGKVTPIAGNCAPIIHENQQIIGVVIVFQDQIVEREAKKKLFDSEVRYRRLFETAKDGILLLNAETGMIDDVNPFLVKMLGYSHEQFLGKHIWELGSFRYIIENRDRFLELQNKEYIHYEDIPLETANGRRIEVEFVGNVYSVDHQKVIQCNIRDVTERKRAEERLFKLTARQEALLSAVPDIIMEVNGNKEYTWANLLGIEFFGDDVIGKEASFYFEGEQETYNTVQKLFGGSENVFYVESWQRRKDGEKRLLGWRCRVLKDENENVIGALSSAHDITEHKQAEEKLMESEKKYRDLFNNDLAGNFITTVNGEILLCNQAFARTFGFSSVEDALHFNVTGLYKNAEERKQLLKALQEKKKLELVEQELIRPDGKIITILLNEVGEFDENDELVGTQGYLFDITERKKAEEELKKSISLYKLLSENMRDVVWLMDLKMQTTYISSSIEKIRGYTFEEIEQMPLEKHLAPESLQIVMSAFEEEKAKLKSDTNYSFNRTLELEFYRKDGSSLWLENTFSIIRDENGLPVSILGEGRDITQRRQAEKALKLAHDELENLHNNLGEAIFSFDVVQNKMLQASLGHEAVFGYPREEFFKNPQLWYERVLTEDKPIVDAGYPFLLSGESLQHEVRIVRADGQIRWIETKVNPTLDANGKLVLIDGIVSDITERKQIQEEIKKLNAELEQRVLDRTAQLNATNKELEAFSYSVSHDLRAPLRAIDGYTRILFEENEPKLDEEGKRLCAMIRENTLRMGKLIDDLLSFSRLSRIDLNISRIDMHKLASSVYDEITLPEQRQRIVFQLGEITSVHGDKTLLRQVLTNLISNAVKFSSHCEKAIIKISCKRDKNTVVYRIRDNGAGFDMKYKDKLFGVFQRLHSLKDLEGTGVGLAIVQQIIFRHGGKVWAEGKVNKGASFYFSIPIKAISQNKQAQDERKDDK